MALGTQPVGKLLDYEQYIDHQIERTRSRIKTTDLVTAALLLAQEGGGEPHSLAWSALPEAR